MRSVRSAFLPWLLLVTGCASFQQPQPVANPFFVPVSDQETLWEDTVDVLHEYQLPIRRENRLDGIIETDYKPGAGVLEPWHHDAVTAEDRLEGSLQSIRRRATVSIIPAQGGHFVAIEVLKELEDPQKLIVNSPGYATFQESQPVQKNLDVVIGPSTQDGWILQGRDYSLEQELLHRMQAIYSSRGMK